MSAKEKAKISGPAAPGGESSSGDVAGIAQAGEDQGLDPLRDCEQAVRAWFDGVHDFVHCGAAALSGENSSERADRDDCRSWPYQPGRDYPSDDRARCGRWLSGPERAGGWGRGLSRK